MLKKVELIKIFLASPGDVQTEKIILKTLLQQLIIL